MSVLSVLLGAALLAVALADVFLTVLYVRGNSGLVAPLLGRGVWRAARWLARRLPMGGDRILAGAGPAVLVAIAVTWALLIVLGFALVAWPSLGHGVRASDGATPQGFAAAVYYAAMSLTTLGTGDLVPRTPAMRLLMVLQAALGFSLLTLTLTYVMSVYSALVRRNTFATSVHHLTAASGDSVELLSALAAGGRLGAASDALNAFRAGCADLHESHHAYPVLHYFRFPEPRYAVARIAFVALDVSSLLHAALDQREYRSLLAGSAARGAWSSGLQVLSGLGATFLPPSMRPGERPLDMGPAEATTAHAPVEAPAEAWRARFDRALSALEQEDVALAPREEAFGRYVQLRSRWQPWVEALAQHMAHDPGVIASASRDER